MDLQALQDFRLRPIEHAFNARDTILYGLGVGYGDEPANPAQLQYVYEAGLRAVPSMCNVLAHPGFWLREPSLKLDWVKVLHGEQSFRLERPLPSAGTVRGEYEVVAVEDKGVDKGAVLHVDKRLFNVEDDALLATVSSVYMLRGDGGHGAFGVAPPPAQPMPDGDPDVVVDLKVLPQAALIYRLSGDLNPIHADPEAARRAGFDRPILHGLCSMGLATRALVEGLADGEPERLTAVSLRFSKPVFPGETLRTEIFKTQDGARFRARVVDRDLVVLDRGSVVLNPSKDPT